MSNLKEKTLGLLGFLLAMSLSTFSAQAQEDAVEEAQVEIQEADEDDDTEEVVVTGSRLRRNTFSSISPLQVIDTEATREIGLLDASDILQESTSAAGQQIDLSFSGFVLDNGPGASTASLRGLGASRTLVMVNSRRLGPSGVEGVPSSPDLNLIPSGLVDRYDFLLDGASSIYGSDAVAGVVNVIMKKDFDGLELELNTSKPEQSGGESYNVSATYGKNFDRGFFGVGLEHYKSEKTTLADRSWTAECNKHLEIDQSGVIRDVGFDDQEFNGQGPSFCKRSGLAGRIIVGSEIPFNALGSIYFTPGEGNVLADWSESGLFGAINVDADGDGVTDVDFQNHIINGNDTFGTLFPEVERTSFMALGEYTFEGNMNLTPFFELMYNERETLQDSGAAQLFPFIAADNPFSPCNPDGDGVDCGSAFDTFLTNPFVVQDFINAFGVPPTAFGLGTGDPVATALGPVGTRIVASVRGDRNTTLSSLEQTRWVAGLKGDLPQIPIGGKNDWQFEISAFSTNSDGTASRLGIRQDKIDAASTTITDPTSPTGLRCSLDGDLVRESTEGCYAVNFFAPSLYAGVVGDFATQGERDFLFDDRKFKTVYEQTVAALFLNGSLFEMQGGTAQGGFGYQYRDDKIESLPDDIARDGLFFGFFTDEGGSGDKYTRELFGEVELPIFANKPLAKELTLNLSANFTQDEVHDEDTTYAAKIAYRPVDSLLLRATRGTSYQAPNLRQTFLAGQSGFSTVGDPCAIPADAYDVLNDVYVAANDQRSPELLANCLATGVDPTALYIGGFNSYSIEAVSGGIGGLKSETSDSFTAGFSYDIPFFESFDMNLGASYYDVEINDTIVEPSAAGVVASCYFDREGVPGGNPNCTRISRVLDGNGNLTIDTVDASFINRDAETVRGLDVNLLFRNDVTLFDRAIDFTADLNMNRTIERTFVSSDVDTDTGATITQSTDIAGRFGYPAWTGNLALRGEYNDYTLTWGSRYIGEVEQFGHEYSDIFDLSSTCFGPSRDDLLCKDVNFAGSYVIHSLSLFYRGDQWTIGGGVNNLFDKAPPRIDTAQVTGVNNTPIGYGYDLNGRSLFLTLGTKFNF